MEKKKKDWNNVKEQIDKLTTPIFEKAAKEIKKNQMLVGSKPTKQVEISYYTPHNFRRYYQFSRKNFNPKPKRTPLVSKTNPLVQCSYNVINSNEYFFDNFYGCSIRVKKKTIQINNKKEQKRKYPITLGSVDERKQQIRDITEKKERECLEVLKLFIKIFGGESNFTIVNAKSEDKCENERMINKLPLKQQWHTPIVKKVYNEKNIEFSDSVYAANYYSNRGIEDIAPEIAQELAATKEMVKGVLDMNVSTSKLINQHVNLSLQEAGTLKEFHKDVRIHNKVLKDLSKAVIKLDRSITERQKKLGDYF